MPRPSPARPGGPPSTAASHHSPHGGLSSGTGFGGSVVSRVLPQRSWAGAIPTILTHEAFEVLCTPSTLPGKLYIELSLYSIYWNFLFLLKVRWMKRSLPVD